MKGLQKVFWFSGAQSLWSSNLLWNLALIYNVHTAVW